MEDPGALNRSDESMAAKGMGIIVKSPKLALVLCLTSMVIGPLVDPSYAGWLIYSKPAFEGRVVDTGTSEPIEGAVVAATYYKRYYTPISSDIEPIEVKQALTDKDGWFRFPAYTTIVSPLCTMDRVDFTIFRSDYTSVDRFYLESIFTGKPPEEQYKEDIAWEGRRDLIIRFAPGVVALSKLRTKEEMRTNALSIYTPFPPPKDSLLNKAVYEAQRRTNR
jgi:hypothetical protein